MIENFDFQKLTRSDEITSDFDGLDDFVIGLRSDCGASSGDEIFCRVHFSRFVLKERDCSLHLRPWESSPAPNEKRPRVPAPLREAQQLSDGRRKLSSFFRLPA